MRGALRAVGHFCMQAKLRLDLQVSLPCFCPVQATEELCCRKPEKQQRGVGRGLKRNTTRRMYCSLVRSGET